MVMDSLVDCLEASAAVFPDRLAVADSNGQSLTYRELDEGADRLCGYLLSAGVQPGDRVGVVLPKSAWGVQIFFGIMKARAAYVPADFTAPVSRNRTILADCDVRVAFLSPGVLGLLDDWPAGKRPPAVVSVGDSGAEPHGRVAPATTLDEALAHPRARVERRRDDDLAYILYTSGSTGVPKGVMLTHRNALSFVDWCSEVFAPSEDDRFSSHAPFHFDLSVLDLYVPLKHGASVHVISEDLGKSAKALAEYIAAERLTVWYSTPSILRLLAEFGDLPSRDYSALRLVLFAGEVFPVKHLRTLVHLWPDQAYYNLYGPTETNVCTFAPIPTSVPDDRTAAYPIGPCCSHCEGLVVDADGAEVPPGGEGLLFISGPSVFQGYWNRPDLNARVFMDRHGQRWYNTGDVVREDLADGYIYVGRRDRMVKRRGYRIELGEVERGLYAHPQIEEAAVLALTDESDVRIAAFLSMRTAERPSIIALKQFCAQALPSYMNPDVFIVMDALPRTSTNKVDYQSLLQAVPKAPTGR